MSYGCAHSSTQKTKLQWVNKIQSGYQNVLWWHKKGFWGSSMYLVILVVFLSMPNRARYFRFAILLPLYSLFFHSFIIVFIILLCVCNYHYMWVALNQLVEMCHDFANSAFVHHHKMAARRISVAKLLFTDCKIVSSECIWRSYMVSIECWWCNDYIESTYRLTVIQWFMYNKRKNRGS